MEVERMRGFLELTFRRLQGEEAEKAGRECDPLIPTCPIWNVTFPVQT
jgi:hypothetical protein